MRFCRIESAPKQLKDDEYVIYAPKFYDIINNCMYKRSQATAMSVNYLRELIGAAGMKYIGADFDALTVNVSAYKGVTCDSLEKTHEVLMDAMSKKCPQVIDAYVEHWLKQRPPEVKLVYYLGGTKQCGVFLKSGFKEVLEKDLKPKKAPSKPAITNEEAAAKKSESVV